MSKPVTAARVAYRFLSGHELDGVKRTDATWRTKGRDLRHGVRDAWHWHYLPRMHRAGWRVGTTTVLVAFAYGSITAPVQTWFVVQAIAGFGVCVLVHWGWGKFQTFEVARRWLGPLAVVLGARCHIQPGDPKTWITVPADCRTNADHPVEIVLPADYRETQRQQEESARVVARKTKMKSHDFSIDHEGPRPKMLVRAMEVPPDRVLFDEVRDALDRSGDGHYFLGLGLRGAEVWADLNGDGPHWVWSCGTGAGKTTAGRNVAAQVRREGGRVVIFDPAKEGDSHSDWIYDEHGDLLDGIEHYTDVESTHEALVRLGEERRKRARLAREAKRFRRPEPRFQRVLVIFEEQNAAYDLLTDYWKYLRKLLKAAEGEDQPETSPAMTATKALVYTGRSAMMNCFVSCQRFDAKIVGGGDVRGNFMVRMLARFDDHARKMLIPDIDPKPVSSNHLGRAIVCMGGVAAAFQGVFMTPDEARDWSSEGRPLVVEHLAPSGPGHDEAVVVSGPDQQEQASGPGQRTHLQLVTPIPEVRVEAPTEAPRRRMTIRQALDEGVVSGNYESVSRASRRAGFPEDRGRDGNALTYFEDELADWEERRPRKTAPAGVSGGDAS